MAAPPSLTYPLEWEYRVIGASEEGVRESIAKVMQSRVYRTLPARPSTQGRWVSVHVHVIVESEAERDALHVSLKAEAGVRLVM